MDLRHLEFEVASLRSIWQWLRQVSGDAAYERYLQSVGEGASIGGSCCSGEEGGREPVGRHILTRREFYLDALERRYSGVSRCC